jgi:hypothetical protein
MVEIRRIKPSIKLKIPVKPPVRSGWTPEVRERLARKAENKVFVVRRLVDHPPPTPLASPCRLWQGSIDPQGYGRRKYDRPRDGKRVTIGVHRWVMEQSIGREMKRWEFVMHLCDNRLCYRLDHLQLGDAKQNNHDMMRKGRMVHVVNVVPGERNGNSKLKGGEVMAIRRKYRRGLSMTSLAEEYFVSKATISRVVRGITWATGDPVDLLAEARKRVGQDERDADADGLLRGGDPGGVEAEGGGAVP